ncbi:hypothetical protein O181_078283 [Austropuccinia psidii MF-1]|uniref:Integrase catalytic domain-containing protein n=1 Tax=Austropuccinia psidii MF-1 TaxID=1389203 RepID=A0A9Q3IEI0_9BASI|nr:hypothetical protein [Austropuccinia psidii MF-1]
MASASSKLDLEDLRAALANVDQIDTRVRKRLETERLGQSIAPHLTRDGLNFCHWSRSLCHLVEDIFDQENYFEIEEDDALRSRNNAVQIFILKSIDDSLLSYVEDVTSARKIYSLLESRFTHTSWSHVMNLFTTIINDTNDLESPDNGYAKIQDNLKKLKTAIGGQWNDDSLMAMFFHHCNRQYFHQIANAVDARISIDPSIKVRGRDILEIAHRLKAREQSGSSGSVMAMNTRNRFGTPPRFPPQQASREHHLRKSIFTPPTGDAKFKRYPHPSTRSEAWARQWLSPEHPCVHCWEWGHWAQDCPRKRAGKPAAEDPRIKQPGFKLRKSQHVSHPALAGIEVDGQCEGNVAAIAKPPANDALVLLDSGATHHVTNNRSIFVTYRPVNFSLSVATTDKHQVKGMGTIRLSTPVGDMYLSNCLHCEQIPGIVISLGKFAMYDGVVEFRNEMFYLYQNNLIFATKRMNDRWFLDDSKIHVDCNEVQLKTSKNDSVLLHQRLAHLSMRTIRRMFKLDVVKGLQASTNLSDLDKCEPCSLAKSRHLPIKPPSRAIVSAPGDVLAVDLMGPFPQSIDKFNYALIIQDHFSSLVAFIPIKAKSDAAKHVMQWILQFERLTSKKVKRLRSDNGGEFNSKAMEDFLGKEGIIHEKTIPYEHHQNGKVERTNRTLSEST